MRGASRASETAAAQQIKAQFGSTRMQLSQFYIAEWITHALRIKAEIIAKHWQPETIMRASNIERTPDAAVAMAAIDLIKNTELAEYRISVEADSMAAMDWAAERDAAVQCMQGLGAWLKVKSAEKEADKIGKAESEAAAKVSRVFDKQVADLLDALAKAERPTRQLIAQAERLLRQRAYQAALVDALSPYIREAIATGVDIGLDTVTKIAPTVDFEAEREDLARYAETESVRLSRRTAAGVTETQSLRDQQNTALSDRLSIRPQSDCRFSANTK